MKLFDYCDGFPDDVTIFLFIFLSWGKTKSSVWPTVPAPEICDDACGAIGGM
jgi:hypothetical protein